MKYTALLFFIWKSTVRYPLFEQSIILQLLRILLSLSTLGILLFLGTLFGPYLNTLFPVGTGYLSVFLYVTFFTTLIDFILKLFCKQTPIIPSLLIRFPDMRKKTIEYLLLKETFSAWNIYLTIFFLPFLIKYIQPQYTTLIFILAILLVYSLQLNISQLASSIKRSNNKLFYFLLYIAFFLLFSFYFYRIGFPRINHNFMYLILPITLLLLFVLTKSNSFENKYYLDRIQSKKKIYINPVFISQQNILVNYLLFNIKMIIRSPIFQKQAVSFIILTIIYLSLFSKFSIQIESIFLFKIVYVVLACTMFPLIFNQYLFSAEASFFDHFMIIPNFKKILMARYLLYISISLIPTIILYFLFKPSDIASVLELTSILLYSLGTITLLCFSSILVAETKVNLVNPQYNISNPPSGQSLIILVIYALSISLIGIIYLLTSIITTVYIMLTLGIVSIILSNYWFSFLYTKFYSTKYEKIKNFREQ